jgi:hypothetical protein
LGATPKANAFFFLFLNKIFEKMLAITIKVMMLKKTILFIERTRQKDYD